jgi:Protein of unknown function (DUF3489)
MKWPQRKRPERGYRENMSLHLTKEGITNELPEEDVQLLRPERMESFEEWNRMAGAWPLKRLVALWNDLPGVTPVGKFTSREIALRRIWQALHAPESALPKKADEQSRVPFREGSKAAQVYALLCRPEGATARQIGELTGWQRHSVRGFLSASLRKQGRKVRAFTRAGERVYRLKS